MPVSLIFLVPTPTIVPLGTIYNLVLEHAMES